EQQPRQILDFIWPLDELPEKEGSVLVLRVIQNPGLGQWLFLRSWVEGDATAKSFRLSCYPADTSGPPQRRRLVSDGTTVHDLHTGPFQPAPTAHALALYNRYAQTDAGCLLVYAPSKSREITVSGTYGITIRFLASASNAPFTAAIGYFR